MRVRLLCCAEISENFSENCFKIFLNAVQFLEHGSISVTSIGGNPVSNFKILDLFFLPGENGYWSMVRVDD